MSLSSVHTTSDYEDTINLIPGIVANRVVIDNDQVAEVHVLSDTTRHPMQLVRDIESSLLARYGIRVDRRRVSVAQIDPVHIDEPRLVLEAINLSIAGNEAEVRAELSWQNRRITGIARGPATNRSRLVLASQATLRAVGELLPAHTSFSLENLDTIQLAGERCIIVLITLLRQQQLQNFSGTAYIRRDETEAAGRATLAAVNRRLAALLTA